MKWVGIFQVGIFWVGIFSGGIFLEPLDREQRKLLFTRFNSENILPSLVLETGTINNNLIINSTSLQLLLLDAAKNLLH